MSCGAQGVDNWNPLAPHYSPAPWRETVPSSTLSGKPSGPDMKEASLTRSAWLSSWGCPWWWFSRSSSSAAIAAVAGHPRAANSQTRTRRKRRRKRRRRMKTSGSLLSPSSSRWRRGHRCLSIDQGGRGNSPWSRTSHQPQRETWQEPLQQCIRVHRLLNQGTNFRLSIPMDGSTWTILTVSWQLCVR